MRTETVGDSTDATGVEAFWLTAEQTRSRLNCSDSMLKRLDKIGALRPRPFGRERRFVTDEVKAFAALGVEKLLAISEKLAALSQRNKARAAKRNGKEAK
ncbi:MAG TPA: hypothetical protein VFA51_07275 [Candidatus Udaeobacter sp.]|nr:hypothetical protein [Candidatus Udaeobacter sp.]